MKNINKKAVVKVAKELGYEYDEALSDSIMERFIYRPSNAVSSFSNMTAAGKYFRKILTVNREIFPNYKKLLCELGKEGV